MTFIQAMDYATSNPKDMERLFGEWEQATEGKRAAKRIVRTKYRDDPDRYFDLVFFDSFETAMENSELQETQEFAEKQRSLVDGDITYLDLEVIEEKQV